jgi:hypothetical protein
MLQLLEHGADARIVNLRGRSVANLAKGPVLQALREYQLRLQAVPAYAVVEMPGGERAFIQMSQTAAAELAECFENADRSPPQRPCSTLALCSTLARHPTGRTP